MRAAHRFLFASALLLLPLCAAASGFTDDKATVIANGTTCKNSTIQFIPAEDDDSAGKIVVSGGKGSCKKVGFAKKLGELTDVSWNDKQRSVDFTVEGDSSYSITVKNKLNYESMRQALVDAV